jgi:sugar phosphate isomerase/epimerase
MKKISIGSWAYVLGPYKTNPVDFHTVLHKLQDMGFDGVELGGFPPHPNPDQYDTQKKRHALRKEVQDHGLEFSGLAANLWMHKVISVPDSGPYIAEFARNVLFAEDLGIDLIRVDTLEPPDIFQKTGLDPRLGRERIVKAWDKCAKIAADRGMRVAWEFEPGFAFNKPSEIVSIVDEVRSLGNPNFGVLFDTSHAYMVSVVGARQPGEKETLKGGVLELIEKLKGKITHLHLIDSDGTCHKDEQGNDETSTHAPFGKGLINWDEVIPALLRANIPSDWWCIDLCFWPDAWTVTADCKRFIDTMRKKYAA